MSNIKNMKYKIVKLKNNSLMKTKNIKLIKSKTISSNQKIDVMNQIYISKYGKNHFQN